MEDERPPIPAANTEGDGDEAQAERERRRLYARELRKKRADAGLCVHCGGPLLPEADAAAAHFTKCAACRARRRAAEHERRTLRPTPEEREHDERRAKRRAEQEARRSAPDGPACTHCGGRELAPHGRNATGPRYRCRACGRTTYGGPGKRKGYPCPNPRCGGNCRKRGHDRHGRQIYHCPKCGRHNTRLWPSRVDSPGGPFSHHINLYLSLNAERALSFYLQKHTMSPAQAVRAIFRPWADEPTIPLPRYLGVDAWGEPVHAPRLDEPREDVNTRRIDLRRSATSKRMAGGNRNHLTILVTWHLSVCLDDTAYQGLLRYMRRTGLEHQDAARAMIIAAGREARGQNDWWAKPPKKGQRQGQ